MSDNKPKKKSTITDVALRLFFSDLLDRRQVRPGDLGRRLGFKNSDQIAKFLKGTRNYSRRKLNEALDILVKVYGANREYLETGHGKMYSSTPYVANEEYFSLSEPENIATHASRQRIKELEEINKKLSDRNKELQELLKAKEEIIELQKKIIEASGFPGTQG